MGEKEVVMTQGILDVALLKKMANAVRFLSIDSVERATSGHPGLPMGMADVATVLFTQALTFNASNPEWFDRDRFVLSAGHGSALLYSLLYLNGFVGIEKKDLERFRQLGSLTPGHPEYGHTPGVETTTGPLGQGFANGVGFALAEEMMRAEFGSSLVDHRTYVLAGDGCLMEGITHEALSFAGHYRLSKLTVLFDDNHISIDGTTDLSVSEDIEARFKAAHWDVFSVDGYDYEGIYQALQKAKRSKRPCLIACRTIIGFGAPTKQGSEKVHGSPLGVGEVAKTRAALDWPYKPFEVPDSILSLWRRNGQKGDHSQQEWQRRVDRLPRGAKETFLTRVQNPLAGGEWRRALEDFKKMGATHPSSMATRVSSGKVIEVLQKNLPSLVGGSADLTESTNTKPSDMHSVTPHNFNGRYIHYGVREHAMGAIMNGLTLHGGFIPYGSTFLVFSDYMRPAIRLSALMGIRVIYLLTHDSVGMGEDGPTHQPVEHLASLRAMPNCYVFRPADTIETAESWECALERGDGPSVVALSRQNLVPVRDASEENLTRKGAYILREAQSPIAVVLVATGSEVGLALGVRDILEDRGMGVQVISMPCVELYKGQPQFYKDSLFPKGMPLFSLEAGVPEGLISYLPPVTHHFGVTHFGASGPGPQVMDSFGLTASHVSKNILQHLEANGLSQRKEPS